MMMGLLRRKSWWTGITMAASIISAPRNGFKTADSFPPRIFTVGEN